MKDRIKQIRKAAGLTQYEFGERLGYAPSSAASWEKKDAQMPPDTTILLICKTFHVREEWLRTGEGEMYEQNAHTILDQLAEEYRLGPAGRMIVDAALKMYDIGGERAFVEMIRDLLPVMQDIVAQAEGRAFIDAAPQDSTAERSASV